MRIVNLLLTTTVLTLLSGFSSGAQAAGGTIKVTSIAEVEVTVTAKDGKKILHRTPVEKAIPGTEVIYTNTFENVGKQAASNIVINNPIPNASEYKAGSAFGRDCEILFSVDGGKKFGLAEDLKIKDAGGMERTALAREYTHIRWTYKGQLAAGKSSEVGFRATIK